MMFLEFSEDSSFPVYGCSFNILLTKGKERLIICIYFTFGKSNEGNLAFMWFMWIWPDFTLRIFTATTKKSHMQRYSISDILRCADASLLLACRNNVSVASSRVKKRTSLHNRCDRTDILSEMSVPNYQQKPPSVRGLNYIAAHAEDLVKICYLTIAEVVHWNWNCEYFLPYLHT
jgi:hypothetical protein